MNPNRLFFNIIFFLFSSLFCQIHAITLVIDGTFDPNGYHDREDIRKVVIGESSGIEEIPDYAFLGCHNLREVYLPKSIKKIGFQAFSECSSLETINLPEGLEDIGSNSFAYCSKLKISHFPDSLLHIGHNAFSFCDSIEEVVLPDSIKELESYAFSDCASLRSARLPANGHLLGELIFNCCPQLISITMPSPVMPEIDCGSFLFDPLDYSLLEKCHLYVPSSLLKSYKDSPSYSVIPLILPMK